MSIDQPISSCPGSPDPYVPPPVPGEVSRANLVKQLADMYSSERNVILTEGDEFTGKTVLLSQFCRQTHDLVVSHFISTDYWSSTPNSFLEGFCRQMNDICHLYEPQRLDGLTEVELRTCFDQLYRMVPRVLSRTGRKCFFVVDGLDHISAAYGATSILTFLPTSLREGMYLLLSSRPGRSYSFRHERIPIPYFSLPETQAVLEEYLSREQIKAIYQKSGGMPGYIGEVYRQLREGGDADSIVADLPDHVRGLVQKQCVAVDTDNRLKRILAVLAYSFSVLDIPSLSRICNEPQEYTQAALSALPFIVISPDTHVIRFSTPVHRTYLRDHFDNTKAETYDLLIRYYEGNPPSEKTSIELPILYSESGRYDSLVEILSPESIASTLSTTHSPSLTLGNLNALSASAVDRSDWDMVAYSSLAETVLRFLIQRPPPLESEIEALLKMGLLDDAMSAIATCGFPEDKLYLLARMSRVLGQKQIPVPESLVSLIDQVVDRVPSLVDMGDRLFTVITDLFAALPDVALRLIHRLKEERTGSGALRGHALDDFLSDLALVLGDDPTKDDEFSEPISRESLLDFLRIASTDFESLSPSALFNRVDIITDASARVFFLLAWLKSHRSQPGTAEVLTKLLNTLNTNYPPTLRRLRQLTEFIPELTDEDIKKELLDRIVLLKGTVAQAPREEAVRLDLLIARAEAAWSQDAADIRLYRLYLEDFEDIGDKDVRCVVLAHVLVALPALRPLDRQLYDEVLGRLLSEFRGLLGCSAEHWKVARKTVGVLAEQNDWLSLDMAKMLNTSFRRDEAFEHILNVHTRREPSQVNVGFVLSVLDEIVSPSMRARTFVNVLRRISRNDTLRDLETWVKFEERSNQIRNPSLRIYAHCYILRGMPNTDQVRFTCLWRHITDQLAVIVSPEDRLAVKLSVCSILADRYPEAAKGAYAAVDEEKGVPLVASGLTNLYSKTLHLAIRMIPDFLKARDKTEKLQALLKAIDAIPSLSEQVSFLADTAIRFYLAGGAKQQFDEISLKVLDLMDSDEAEGPYLLYLAGPAIFEYNRDLFDKLLSALDPVEVDGVLARTAEYVLSGRSPTDPVDLVASVAPVDYARAEKCCWLLERTSHDSLLVRNLGCLIDRLVRVDNRGVERTTLREPQILPIAERLSRIITTKLPNPKNIRHDGFRLVALSHLCRLRHAADRHKPFRSGQWKSICPPFPEIAQEARCIPNLADRPYVLMKIGSDWSRTDQSAGNALLNEAGELIEQCGNRLDKAERYAALASCYLDAANENSARFFLQSAFESATGADPESGYRASLESIIEIAHKVSPEFASDLASKIDDVVSREHSTDTVSILSLRSNPMTIGASANRAQPRIIRSAASKIMSSLCSGRTGSTHNDVIGQWMRISQGMDFSTVYPILEWYIENAVVRTNSSGDSSLDGLYGRILSVLGIMTPLARIAVASEEAGSVGLKSADSLNIWAFSAGEGPQLMEKVSGFIQEFGHLYVKIYDPYFGTGDMDLIRAVPLDSHVMIITENQSDSRKSEADFRNAWRQVSDTVPPHVEIYVYGKSGDSPMHDRFIICDKKGLSIGTSVNGYGKRDTIVKMLDEREKAKVESEIVDKMLYHPPLTYNSQRLSRRVFML